jgi:hypothetical protein
MQDEARTKSPGSGLRVSRKHPSCPRIPCQAASTQAQAHCIPRAAQQERPGEKIFTTFLPEHQSPRRDLLERFNETKEARPDEDGLLARAEVDNL